MWDVKREKEIAESEREWEGTPKMSKRIVLKATHSIFETLGVALCKHTRTSVHTHACARVCVMYVRT